MKTIFLWEYCSYYDHANDALYIFNLDMLFHIVFIWLYVVYFTCQLNHLWWSSETITCVCRCANYKFQKKMNIFWSVQMRERVVALLTDVIKQNCVVADGFLVMSRSTWSVYFEVSKCRIAPRTLQITKRGNNSQVFCKLGYLTVVCLHAQVKLILHPCLSGHMVQQPSPGARYQHE